MSFFNSAFISCAAVLSCVIGVPTLELTPQQQAELLREAGECVQEAIDHHRQGSASEFEHAAQIAATKYEQLIASGIANFHLYVNAGHAHRVANQHAQAIVCYRLALNQRPGNREIGLHLAELEQSMGVLQPQSVSVLSRLARWNALMMDVHTRIAITVGAWALCWALAMGWWLKLPMAGRLFGLCTVTCCMLVASCWWQITSLPQGLTVVIIEPTMLHEHEGEYFPATDGRELVAGMTLRVIGQRSNWLKVVNVLGVEGWIPESAGRLVPPPRWPWNR